MSRTDDKVLFGSELLRLREHAGLSQRTVGNLIEANGGEKDVSGSAVGEWERGMSKPTPRTVAALEKILGIEPGELGSLLGYGASPLADEVAELRAEVRSLAAAVTEITAHLVRLGTSLDGAQGEPASARAPKRER